ncbi:hypothetical protein MMC26_001041 [Xylographa opegraphella]|nr:hypothetical protein [Xylographa opegraphella]
MDAKAPLLPTTRTSALPRLTRPQSLLRTVFHISTALILLLALLSVLSLGVGLAVSAHHTTPVFNTTAFVPHSLVPRFLPSEATIPPVHGRCNVHVYQSPYFMNPGIPGGSLWVRVTDNADRDIGHLNWTDWNTANGPTEFNISTRVGFMIVDVLGFDVDFAIGKDDWRILDRRCHLGNWDRAVFLKWDLRRPNRQMDCGFAC